MGKNSREFPAKGILTSVPVTFFLGFLMTFFPGFSMADGTGFQNVLVISVDALHPNALGPENSPVIYKLMREGVYTPHGRSTQPPMTLIAHTAMFTGLEPKENGKTDNNWDPGSPTVALPTIFNAAKEKGFVTGYFYSKKRMGYLVNKAVDEHRLSEDFAEEEALRFFKKPGRHFAFLHISGLDYAGPVHGWLSPEYMEELLFIDQRLERLIETVRQAGNYLLIVTGDHAGHDRIHGSDHPEDAKLPLVMISDRSDLSRFRNIPYSVCDLKTVLGSLLESYPSVPLNSRSQIQQYNEVFTWNFTNRKSGVFCLPPIFPKQRTVLTDMRPAWRMPMRPLSPFCMC